MPVSGLNIAVRRPLGSDITQAPIIPASQVETVLRKRPITQAARERFPFYFEKKRRFFWNFCAATPTTHFTHSPFLINPRQPFQPLLSPQPTRFL